MAADGNRWGGVGEAGRGAAEGEPSGPVISPSVSEERRSLPPTPSGCEEMAADGDRWGGVGEERRTLPPTLN